MKCIEFQFEPFIFENSDYFLILHVIQNDAISDAKKLTVKKSHSLYMKDTLFDSGEIKIPILPETAINKIDFTRPKLTHFLNFGTL